MSEEITPSESVFSNRLSSYEIQKTQHIQKITKLEALARDNPNNEKCQKDLINAQKKYHDFLADLED